MRNFAYDRWLFETSRTELPVICVGNVTVGGSGKSPFTGYLAQELQARNQRPTILSRGYRGRLKGPHLVQNSDSVEQVGDEALMHCHTLGPEIPIVISKDRARGAEYIEDQQLGNIILLDDGFQHRRLERDLNLLLLDISSEKAISKWLNGRLLPAGYLREHLSQALARTDLVVFVQRTGADPSEVVQLSPYIHIPDSISTISFTLSPSHFIDSFSGQHFTPEHFAGKRGTAVTAIGSPEDFFSMLNTSGIILQETLAFRDHHHFSQGEWETKISNSERPIFTTAKDAVKLRRFVDREDLLYVLALKARISSDTHENQLWQAIQKAIGPKEE